MLSIHYKMHQIFTKKEKMPNMGCLIDFSKSWESQELAPHCKGQWKKTATLKGIVRKCMSHIWHWVKGGESPKI